MEGQAKRRKQERPVARPSGRLRRGVVLFFKILLPLVVLSLAGLIGVHLIKTAPQAKKMRPPSRAPLVETKVIKASDQPVVITAMGSVTPARKINLRSRVAGQITAVSPNFVEGGLLKKGERVVQIDPQDYKLAVVTKKTQVTEAEYALELEEGHQAVARREWELLKKQGTTGQDSDLALRKPQLKKAKADLAAAKAALEQAELNLARTKVIAPFNAVVSTKNVDLGSQVSTADQLATLVGIDEYWVQTALPLDRLSWIKIPLREGQDGSRAKIIYGPEAKARTRRGRVVKLLSSLETEGRMARLLIAVQDPLGLKQAGGAVSPLLIGDYVRVEIDGGELKGVFRLPRNTLHEGDIVWLVDGRNRLKKQKVRVAWRNRGNVLVSGGLSNGMRVIVSDLSSPVEGMAVRFGGGDGSQGRISPAGVAPDKNAASGQLD